MGNFKQHITCSTATGIAVAGIAYHFGIDLPTCLVSAGLCSFAGMLPDIDSDTSKSFQECIYLTAGVGCILAADRFRQYVDPDFAMFGGAIVFLLIRFGLAPLIKKITVHRGMIHSIPMAILCGQLVFFVVTGTVAERLVKAVALTIGFLSHLILDETYSIDSTGNTLRLKKSFGTALKWTNPKRQGAVTLIYSLIILFGLAACNSPDVVDQLGGGAAVAKQSATPTAHDDIQLEIEKFLAEQVSPSPVVQSHTPAVAKPTDLSFPLLKQNSVPESVLPSAMQIEPIWNRNAPIQPAAIVVQ
jgi:membrane-bound metal-dependent hydrolase YbcI (DUF457 family)